MTQCDQFLVSIATTGGVNWHIDGFIPMFIIIRYNLSLLQQIILAEVLQILNLCLDVSFIVIADLHLCMC